MSGGPYRVPPNPPARSGPSNKRASWLERQIADLESKALPLEHATIPNGREVQIVERVQSATDASWLRVADATHSIMACFPSTSVNKTAGQRSVNGLASIGLRAVVALHDVKLALGPTPDSGSKGVLHLVVHGWALPSSPSLLVKRGSKLVDIAASDQFRRYQDDLRKLTAGPFSAPTMTAARALDPPPGALRLTDDRTDTLRAAMDRAYQAAGGPVEWTFGFGPAPPPSPPNAPEHAAPDDRKRAVSVVDVDEPSAPKRRRLDSPMSDGLAAMHADVVAAARAQLDADAREAHKLGIAVEPAAGDASSDPVASAVELGRALDKVRQRTLANKERLAYQIEPSAPPPPPPIAVSQPRPPRPSAPARPVVIPRPLTPSTASRSGFFSSDIERVPGFRHGRPTVRPAFTASTPSDDDDERSTTHDSFSQGAGCDDDDGHLDAFDAMPFSQKPARARAPATPAYDLVGGTGSAATFRPPHSRGPASDAPSNASSRLSSRFRFGEAQLQVLRARRSGDLIAPSSAAAAVKVEPQPRPKAKPHKPPPAAVRKPETGRNYVLPWPLPVFHQEISAALDRLAAYNAERAAKT